MRTVESGLRYLGAGDRAEAGKEPEQLGLTRGASPALAASPLGDRTLQGHATDQTRGPGWRCRGRGHRGEPKGRVGSGGRMWGWRPCLEQGLGPVPSGTGCRTGRACSVQGTGYTTCLEGLL